MKLSDLTQLANFTPTKSIKTAVILFLDSL